jgi:hypothetical protein
LSPDRYFPLIVEWRTGEILMARKAKTKTTKADEDANLDEALNGSFPASDPPSMTQPRTAADVTGRRPRRHPKGKTITAAR